MAADSVCSPQVQDFVRAASPQIPDDCLILVLQPWPGGDPPGNVLAPRETFSFLDPSQVTYAVSRQVLLIPCTFERAEEEKAAVGIIQQLQGNHSLVIFGIQLLPEQDTLHRNDLELLEIHTKRLNAMLEAGMEDVIVDLGSDASSLRSGIRTMRHTWSVYRERAESILSFEPEAVSQETLSHYEQWHHKLLWQTIPRALMPQFPPLNRSILENKRQVDQYRLQRRFQTTNGTVVLGMDAQNQPRVLKIIEKSQCGTPGELEGINREMKFLMEHIRHPNVIRCLGMLHTQTRIYFVLEFGGNWNLGQLVAAQPLKRLQESDAGTCFMQMANGLAHCHTLGICHRSLCLEHVVVDEEVTQGERGPVVSHNCRLIDFRLATVSKGQNTCKLRHGTMPFMAPEMALEEAYIPRFADVWSLGVILLECAGGLNSFISYTGVTNEELQNPEAMQDTVLRVRESFSHRGSHAAALARMGGIQHAGFVEILQMMLHPSANSRAEMRVILEIGSQQVARIH